MEDYLAFAKGLAEQAGKIIRDRFDSELNVELKADQTPVTEVDRQINQLVSDAIKQHYPSHGLLGEELSHGSGKEDMLWICDPLDGTKIFTLGVPLSTFVLGLSQDSQIVLSVVFNPYTEQMYHAIRGKAAFCNDRKIKVNNTLLSEAGMVIVSESSWQFTGKLQAIGAQTEVIPGASYRTMLVAKGRCSGSIQSKGDSHDVGPASLIVEEAGGVVTDFSGNKIRFDQPIKNGIILSNGVAHQELLKIIN